MLRPFIVIVLLSGATGALAEPVALTGDELKQAVSGSTVEIDTPLGSTVPMRFGANGLVAAEAGVLAPVLGSAKDRGRWWVDGEKLCTKWFRWFDAGVRCLTIKTEGTRVYWRKIDDGETGTGTLIADAKPQPKPKQEQTVVAKADPPPAQAKPNDAPKAEPVAEAKPSSAPETDKRGTRLAGPPREVPDESGSALAAAKGVEEAAPSVVASAEEKPAASPSTEDKPIMRFGGAGLLEATGLGPTAVTAAEVTPEKKAAEAPRDTTAVASLLPEKQAPGKAETTYVAASALPSKTSATQRQVSLDTPSKPVAKRDDKKRALNTKAKKDKDTLVQTSSSRQVALYRVRGVAEYDVLNVRRGPSEQHVSVAVIPPSGRSVEITGECQQSWCPIRYRGVSGWVNSYYLAEEGTRSEIQGSSAVSTR